MLLFLRRATLKEFGQVMDIIHENTVRLKERGVPQWQGDNAPTLERIHQDSNQRGSFLLMEEKEIVGTAALLVETEPAYDRLKGGTWLPSEASEYAVIHRFAIKGDKQGQGYAAHFMEFLVNTARLRKYKDLRIDTHPKNIAMQKVIEKAGFEKRGEIMLDIPHGERFAYQMLL